MIQLLGLPHDASRKELPESDVDTLFCSIGCMANPVKYIEYTKVEYKFHSPSIKAIDYSTEKVIKKTCEYYSKDSNDIAVLIDFITKVNTENKENFNVNMDQIKILLENNGNFFLLRKEEDREGVVKSKIQLKPIELRTV